MTTELTERQEAIYLEIVNVLMLGDLRALALSIDTSASGATFSNEELLDMIVRVQGSDPDFDVALNKLMQEGKVVDYAETGFSQYGLGEETRNELLGKAREAINKHREETA